MPSSSAYSSRFGSLLRAYGLVGFTPDRDYRYIEINRELRKLHPEVLRQVLDGFRTSGSDAWQDLQTDRVVVNGEFSLSVVIARCMETPTGLLRWNLRFDTSLAPDITIVVRMDNANREPLDYYCSRASTCSPRSCDLERRMRLGSMPIASTASAFFMTSPCPLQLRRLPDACCSPSRIEMIPISRITVLNPRARNKRQHREIVNNIEAIGLKRPITVSRRDGAGGPRYDLVCGEGRLEAFQMLGQTEIPAVVIEASESECLVMSLVENIARRTPRPIDLMKEIGALRSRGFSDAAIAEKIGVGASWVNMIASLLERGEERLVSAVETGLIPITLAMEISKAETEKRRTYFSTPTRRQAQRQEARCRPPPARNPDAKPAQGGIANWTIGKKGHRRSPYDGRGSHAGVSA